MTIRPYRHSIPSEILALSHERDLLRRKGQYDKADLLKQQLAEAGYVVKDNPHGAHLVVLPGVIVDGKHYRTAQHVPSLLAEPDLCTFSINILAQNSKEQTRRCIESILTYAGDASFEIILVDNASLDGLDIWAETLQQKDARVHLLRTTRKVGVAEARNIGMQQSQGHYILLLDTQIEITGDILQPLTTTFADESVGLTGPHGLRTGDLRHFEESAELEVEAIDTTCMVFKRSLLLTTGLFDEGYRSPHFMHIDFSFAVRDTGARIVRTPDLPLLLHPQSEQNTTPRDEAQQSRLSKRNFYRYLDKWGDRDDLLLEGDGDEEYEDDDEDDEEDYAEDDQEQ
jgi:Predicted glycosyltransferases